MRKKNRKFDQITRFFALFLIAAMVIGCLHPAYTVKADEIEGFLREEKWEDFTIKVHALKSGAALIGAADLSEAAAHLEMLGNIAKE